MAFKIRRLSPGNYLVNDSYYVMRVHVAGGPAWLWRHGVSAGVGGEWRSTKAEAIADLKAYLRGD